MDRPYHHKLALNEDSDDATSSIGRMRVTTLTDRCYEQLKDAIITLEIRPGTPLSEHQLAERFGISKSPVREALQRLHRDDLITLEPNRRCVVTGLDVSSVRDWYELRLMLEPTSLSQLATKIDGATIAHLDHITHRAISAYEKRDVLEYIHNSDNFHLRLIDLNPNRSLVAVIHDLFNKIRRVRIAQYQEDKSGEHKSTSIRGLERHLAIIDAISHGDVESAVSLLTYDIQQFIDRLDEGRLSEALARVTFR